MDSLALGGKRPAAAAAAAPERIRVAAGPQPAAAMHTGTHTLPQGDCMMLYGDRML